MKVAILLLLALAFAADLDVDIYEQYLHQFGKTYATAEEYDSRFETFMSNFRSILEHQTNPDRTFDLGLTEFTDWTWEEFDARRLMASQDCSATNGLNFGEYGGPLPSSYDWRKQGVVTHVKDQGDCGSFWTFSTTGAMESHWAILTRSPPPLLSEQQLVDCAYNFDNAGCNGGLPSQAFEYIAFNGGLTTESQYPYTAKDGACTESMKTPVAFAPMGSANITVHDEDAMLRALVYAGPLSIAFEVAGNFQHYTGGVYSSTVCNNTSSDVNHAVLAVGYGTMDGSDYWLVKNSWGVNWGLEGYFMIERGVNMCGLSDCVAFPLVGYPEKSS